MKSMKNKAGFTLVELIVVIAILAILAGIAVPAYSGYIKKSEASSDTQLVAAVKTAVDATLVTEGVVTSIEIKVDGVNPYVKAEIGTGNAYILRGTINDTGDNSTDAMDNDFETYMGGNTIAFKQKINGDVANKATWTTDSGWVFDYESTPPGAGD